MSTRLTPTLLALTAALALGEFISAVIIWRENYPDAQPWFAVVFGVLFLGALWLVRSGRVLGGATLAGLMFLFEVVTFPTWQRYNALDWATQIFFAVLSLAGGLTAIAVLASRVSARRRIAR